jgi:hypothetical protein
MFVFHFINHLDHFDNLVGQSLNQDMAVDVERRKETYFSLWQS